MTINPTVKKMYKGIKEGENLTHYLKRLSVKEFIQLIDRLIYPFYKKYKFNAQIRSEIKRELKKRMITEIESKFENIEDWVK